MKNISKMLLLSLVTTLIISSNVVSGQGHDFAALNKDYPQLMKRYGSRLESRTAHYIFAIDISSSMQVYENVVRQSLATFVKAVPDGDQITLIAMSDENSTNYVNSIKCITINSTVRQSIIQTITSSQFKFLRPGDKHDGSDGYTMTRKVLDAMNVVNSSDLTFVYLLTDFEYWTHKYKFDKSKEDWMGLKHLLTNKHSGMMCKYGIELNSSGVSHPGAIFKPELDNIFGPLDYQQANSAFILKQWFGHIIDEIRAHKINAMLKADWKQYLDGVAVSLQNDGCNLNALICAPESDLVGTVKPKLSVNGGGHLKPLKSVEVVTKNNNKWEATIGRYETDKTWYPSYLKEEPSNAKLIVSFESPYADEIHKLQGVCQEKSNSPNAVKLAKKYTVKLPATKVWNSIVPLWLWIVISVLVLFILVTIVLKYMQKPQCRYTNFVVTRKAVGSSRQYDGDTQTFPYSLGTDGELVIPGATWKLCFSTKRYNPILNPFRKTGYYVTLEEGDFANIVNEIDDNNLDTIQLGQTSFLFKYKKTPMVRIEISEGNTTNIISIS